jgi:formate dehydrogenase alpha subunit
MRNTFDLDGRKISFAEGQTVLEAARDAGINIPSLCRHRKTGAPGNCRLCVVEVEGMEGLQVSCRLPAAAGMAVRAHSETLMEVRRSLIALLLSNGRHDCDTCEADGLCELQEAARLLGVEKPDFIVDRPYPPVDRSSPMIVRRPELCIGCGRCVTACRAQVVHDVLDFGGRGADRRVICDEDLPLGQSDCVNCGECVQLCPTGALLDKATSSRSLRDADPVDTLCPYCGVGCGLTLHVDRQSGKVVGASGTEGHPVSDGMLCVKGRYGLGFIHSEERLTTPLLRRPDGSFRQATWEDAINLFAERFQDLRRSHGPDCVAGLSSAKCTNEENYLFQKLFRQVIGSNNVDHCARLCHSSTVAGMAAAIGSGAMTNDIAGIAAADVILVIGSDTTTAHPVIASRIKQAVRSGGTKLIVIDPKRIDLAAHATLYARQRIGSDVAVINGIMRLIIDRGLHDEAFVEKRCEGFDELRELVDLYTPERVREIAGIGEEALAEIASLFGGAETAAVFFAMGITQHTSGTDNVRSLVNLQLLCGNLGRAGGGINPLRGQCNVQGACDMGALPDYYPGYRKVDDDASRRFFEEAWEATLSRKRGMTAMEMIASSFNRSLKAMFIMGENPVLSDPDVTHVREALSRLDFLVVQDIFLTETARLADLVLPAACFAEKEGLFTNTERRVQRLRPAVAPPGGALEDRLILQKIAAALGRPWPYRSAGDVQEELRRLVPAYGGINSERVDQGGLQWPCPSLDHPGTPVLHADSFPIGRGRMKGAHWRPPAELPDGEFPLVLTTGRLLSQFHTGTMTRRSPGIDDLGGPVVMVSSPDAAALGIVDGRLVEVVTRRGTIRAPARITAALPRGTIFVPFHFKEAAANILTNPAVDRVAGIPEFKICAARVNPVVDPVSTGRIMPVEDP